MKRVAWIGAMTLAALAMNMADSPAEASATWVCPQNACVTIATCMYDCSACKPNAVEGGTCVWESQ